MSNNITTFWSFLNEKPVEIPIIQRDYAQGREGKESLRKSFLTNLKQALDHNMPNGEKSLKLDFVYGSLEENRLNPLDGQQRLTTLWLLHWFIALKAGKLVTAQNILCKFGYETRLTSRDFCHELCKADNFAMYEDGSVVNYILRQTWFYSSWKQDPTIQAMLRMIKGTKITDKNDVDITDGLEELFANTGKDSFEKYWEELISAEAPIIFYHLPLHDFGLSDDLYIKMNARGKQLTSFENFKADFIGYIQEQAKENDSWAKFLDAESGIPIKMDTIWTDIFWKNYSIGIQKEDFEGNKFITKTHKIDEIFFAFFNRFFWNELFIAKNGNDYILNIGRGDDTSTEENLNISYAYLNDSSNKKTFDCRIAYDGFDVYKYLKIDNQSNIPETFFDKIDRVLTNYHEFILTNSDIDIVYLLRCSWNKSFNFIPCYKVANGFNVEIENNKGESILEVTPIGQIERIVFYAVCKFFDEGVGDVSTLNNWMRVVWNLVSGEDEHGRDEIRSTSATRSAIEFIDSLKSHSVYESLKQHDQITGNFAFDQRCVEEIEKAKIIYQEPTWQEKIIEAENYGFCKGAIRFLFQDEKGEVDWSLFDKKYANLRTYFKESCKRDESALNQDSNSADLLKTLISWFNELDYWQVLNYNHSTFNNYPNTWKYYLLNSKICTPIHNLLTGLNKRMLEDSEEEAMHRIYQLSQTHLLDYVVDKIPYSWIRGYHYHTAIYPSSTGIFLNAKLRDEFLLRTEGVTLHNEANVIGTNEFIFGSDIDFCFEGNNYRWFRDNTIYLMKSDKNWEYEFRDPQAKDPAEKYYLFKVESSMDALTIKRELSALANRKDIQENND